jgi:hypothetical protein
MGPIAAEGPRQTSQRNHDNEINGLEKSQGCSLLSRRGLRFIFNRLDLGIARLSGAWETWAKPFEIPKKPHVPPAERRGDGRGHPRLSFFEARTVRLGRAGRAGPSPNGSGVGDISPNPALLLPPARRQCCALGRGDPAPGLIGPPSLRRFPLRGARRKGSRSWGAASETARDFWELGGGATLIGRVPEPSTPGFDAGSRIFSSGHWKHAPVIASSVQALTIFVNYTFWFRLPQNNSIVEREIANRH